MVETTMDIYGRIDYLLKLRNIKRKTMCDDIEIPYNTLNSMIKRRSGNFDLDLLKKIARYLGVSTDYLLDFNCGDDDREQDLLDEVVAQQSSDLLKEIDRALRKRFLVALNNIVVSMSNINKLAVKHGIGKEGDAVVYVSKVLEGMYSMEKSARSLAGNEIDGADEPVKGKEWDLLWQKYSFEKSHHSLIDYENVLNAVVKTESGGTFDRLEFMAAMMVKVPRNKRDVD